MDGRLTVEEASLAYGKDVMVEALGLLPTIYATWVVGKHKIGSTRNHLSALLNWPTFTSSRLLYAGALTLLLIAGVYLGLSRYAPTVSTVQTAMRWLVPDALCGVASAGEASRSPRLVDIAIDKDLTEVRIELQVDMLTSRVEKLRDSDMENTLREIERLRREVEQQVVELEAQARYLGLAKESSQQVNRVVSQNPTLRKSADFANFLQKDRY